MLVPMIPPPMMTISAVFPMRFIHPASQPPRLPMRRRRNSSCPRRRASRLFRSLKNIVSYDPLSAFQNFWIPASAKMTPRYRHYDTISMGGGVLCLCLRSALCAMRHAFFIWILPEIPPGLKFFLGYGTVRVSRSETDAQLRIDPVTIRAHPSHNRTPAATWRYRQLRRVERRGVK